jgi:ribosome-binding protein aMBF1 (putative translation factor)
VSNASKPRLPATPRRPAPGRGADAFARYERARTAIMVGSAVRAARRRAGVSQVELAERAGTSQPSIARLEKGQVSPTVITLDRIARALGADLVIDFEPQPMGRHGTTSPRGDAKS